MLGIGEWQPLYPQIVATIPHESKEGYEYPSPWNRNRDSCGLDLLRGNTNTAIWPKTSLHELSGDSCDSGFCNCGYPCGLSALFTFFSKPKLRINVFNREVLPILSKHDLNQLGRVLQVRVHNRGKTAHMLEASIFVLDLNGMPIPENLRWDMPDVVNPPRVLERLARHGFAYLQIAYMLPKQKIWKIETIETEHMPNPHILDNDRKYSVGLKITHEPSHLNNWALEFTIDNTGKIEFGTINRLKS